MIGAAWPWVALAAAVVALALELRFIRADRGLGVASARRRVPASLDRCQAVALRWLGSSENPLGTRAARAEERRIRFRWGRAGARDGSFEAAAADGETEVRIELDLARLHRLTRRLSLLLWLLVGVPLAVGLPLLSAWLAQRFGRPFPQPLWGLLLIYWPLHPVLLARLETRSTALIADTFLANLPLLAASDPDR